MIFQSSSTWDNKKREEKDKEIVRQTEIYVQARVMLATLSSATTIMQKQSNT